MSQLTYARGQQEPATIKLRTEKIRLGPPVLILNGFTLPANPIALGQSPRADFDLLPRHPDQHSIPLTRLALELAAQGYHPPTIRQLYAAAQSAKFPADQGFNGRWVVARDDLPAVVEAMGLTRVASQQA